MRSRSTPRLERSLSITGLSTNTPLLGLPTAGIRDVTSSWKQAKLVVASGIADRQTAPHHKRGMRKVTPLQLALLVYSYDTVKSLHSALYAVLKYAETSTITRIVFHSFYATPKPILAYRACNRKCVTHGCWQRVMASSCDVKLLAFGHRALFVVTSCDIELKKGRLCDVVTPNADTKQHKTN